jgi:hypothetical protein
MTQYLLTVHGPVEPDDAFGGYGSKEAMEEAFATTETFNEQLRTDGHWVFAGGLRPATTARVVDGRSGAPVVTDGPYLESKELIGGFWIIDVKNKAEAIAWAEKIPFEDGEVEIRRVSEVDDFKYDEVSGETLDMERAFQAEHVKPIKG